jgi:hypothetical protein
MLRTTLIKEHSQNLFQTKTKTTFQNTYSSGINFALKKL